MYGMIEAVYFCGRKSVRLERNPKDCMQDKIEDVFCVISREEKLEILG